MKLGQQTVAQDELVGLIWPRCICQLKCVCILGVSYSVLRVLCDWEKFVRVCGSKVGLNERDGNARKLSRIQSQSFENADVSVLGRQRKNVCQCAYASEPMEFIWFCSVVKNQSWIDIANRFLSKCLFKVIIEYYIFA